YLTTYPLSSNPPEPSNLPAVGPKEESISAVPDEIGVIQSAIQVTREKVARSRADADAVDARRRASDSYLEALDFEAKGLAALDKGKNLADQKEYSGAGESLRDAKTLLSRADEKFVQAKTVSEGAIAREGAKKDKTEATKSENPAGPKTETTTMKRSPAPQGEIETASGGGGGTTTGEAPRQPPPQTGQAGPARPSVVGPVPPPPSQTAPNPPSGSIPPSGPNQYGSGLKGGKNWYDNLGSLEVPGKR
ncbi:MAG TPA: hypothetical protein VFG95_01160, partial [Nitrospiria bacterium]|nr:hypothetical protein [Nitrospiria bacterium]